MKTQKIIEAEANLQAAKMLNAIAELNDSLIDFYAIYSGDFQQAMKEIELVTGVFEYMYQKRGDNSWVRDFKEVKNVFEKVLRVTKALKDYDMKKECKPKLKLVDDIVAGIKLKSKYEQELKENKARLERARALYKELQGKYETTLGSLAKIAGESDSEKIVEELRSVKQYEWNAVIDRLMANYTPKIKCDTDIEMPF